MAEIISQDIPATTITWQVVAIEKHAHPEEDGTFQSGELVITLLCSDGRKVREKISGSEGLNVLQVLNTRDNTVKSERRWLLEQIQTRWPQKYSGTVTS